MRGVHDEHRVKLESDRARLNVSHAREEKGGEDFAVREAGADPCSDFLQQPLAWCFFDQLHERLDGWIEAHGIGWQSSFRRRDARKPEFIESDQRTGRGSAVEEVAARNHLSRCAEIVADSMRLPHALSFRLNLQADAEC